MAAHTTFKVGGPADLWVKPSLEDWQNGAAGILLEAAHRERIPVFVLGGGANLVVSDQGIRGIVLDMSGNSGLAHTSKGSQTLTFRAGSSVDEAVDEAARRDLGGLEFLAGMPGSIGGALWMNARCYDREMADVVSQVELLGAEGKLISLAPKKEEFSYKKSPFQTRDDLILNVSFALDKKDSLLIQKKMTEHRNDREAKGHYRFPSAGSAFKNNRAFGKPTGKIIDELGLKGFALGDAQVAPWHGNIIINRGKARAADIRALVTELQDRAKAALGIDLEPEILFTGDWP
ncbi:UDP-N-acetylenolpyruvoylglucosamine reductase [Spirochaetia bacterium]|nr:UDP-N-acetylenolpyruvoylglucosamine reductase [Spirochaetia bacterium]